MTVIILYPTTITFAVNFNKLLGVGILLFDVAFTEKKVYTYLHNISKILRNIGRGLERIPYK